MPTADDLMTRSPECCRDDESLDHAVRRMRDRDCGFLPVVDEDGFPVGVVTDRDVALAAFAHGKRLSEIRIGDVMSTRVKTCSRSDAIDEVERLLREARVRRLPVIDTVGKVVGVISINDIALAEAWDGPLEAAVEIARTLAEIGEHRHA